MNRKPRLVVPIAELAASVAASSGEAAAYPAPSPIPAPATLQECERCARSRPTLPDLLPALHCLEPGQPYFREPENGELVVGLYHEDNGTAAPLLLWTDPKVDLFWDFARRHHVKPPVFYIRLTEQPAIDPETGYPVIQGAVCPF